MIDTIQDYIAERYLPLEIEFLNATKKFLSDNLPRISKYVIKIPCAYMSVSFLNTAIATTGKTILQIDFYDRQWVYGKPFSRSRMDADFLLTGWKDFTDKTFA